jgi:hypothetical protein
MRRRTLLDHDFNPIKIDIVPVQVSYSWVTESDVIAFTADLRTREAVGHPLHLLRPTGEISSHGGDGSVYRGRNQEELMATSVAGDDEALWLVQYESNRLIRWDLVEKPTISRVFERAIEEFDRHDPETWPGAANLGSMLDEHGLWIVWRAPESGWDPDGSERPPTRPMRTIVDSWVDLVDPSTGRTIARHWSDGFLKGFAPGSRYVFAYEESEAGVPYIHLMEPALSRGGQAFRDGDKSARDQGEAGRNRRPGTAPMADQRSSILLAMDPGSAPVSRGFRAASPAVVACLLHALPHSATVGQEHIVVTESRNMCRNCIGVEIVAVLGGDYDGDDLLSAGVDMFRGPTGRTTSMTSGQGRPRSSSTSRTAVPFGRGQGWALPDRILGWPDTPHGADARDSVAFTGGAL